MAMPWQEPQVPNDALISTYNARIIRVEDRMVLSRLVFSASSKWSLRGCSRASAVIFPCPTGLVNLARVERENR